MIRLSGVALATGVLMLFGGAYVVIGAPFGGAAMTNTVPMLAVFAAMIVGCNLAALGITRRMLGRRRPGR